jgi:hypothetical protein
MMEVILAAGRVTNHAWTIPTIESTSNPRTAVALPRSWQKMPVRRDAGAGSRLDLEEEVPGSSSVVGL